MKIPFHKTHTTDEEIDAVVDAIKSGWLTMGPKVIKFEEDFKKYIGVKHAIFLNSATAALHLALKAIGLKKGDEVIIPTNTFIATAEVITYFEAIPVLCDIEYNTHNIDVSKINSLITNKTRAIIPVHFGGQPCDMDEIKNIAQTYDLKIIEDAAHCLPSSYKGNKIGTIGDITCFSFYATKTLSTGEGGMAVTNNEKYAEIMKINRLHGISKDAWDRYSEKGSWYYEVVDNGNKYNSTDMNAALGIVQLSKVDFLGKKRQEIAKKYYEALKSNPLIDLPFIKKNRTSSFHLFVIKVDNRDAIIEKLKSAGIGTSVHFIPVHIHPYYRDKYCYDKKYYPIANEIFKKSISLPIFPDMTDEEIQYVINTINMIIK